MSNSQTIQDWVQHDSTSGGEHYPTVHIDDLDEKVNQLMAARFTHASYHTDAPPASCSYCYSPSHSINKCPFIRHYTSMINEDDASNSHHKHVLATTIFESEEIVDNNEEEEKEVQVEHIQPVEPTTDTSLSSDKEMSIEAHSFIIVPLETHHESKASIIQCLKEPSYAKIQKDLFTQARKFRNRHPKKIFRSK